MHLHTHGDATPSHVNSNEIELSKTSRETIIFQTCSKQQTKHINKCACHKQTNGWLTTRCVLQSTTNFDESSRGNDPRLHWLSIDVEGQLLRSVWYEYWHNMEGAVIRTWWCAMCKHSWTWDWPRLLGCGFHVLVPVQNSRTCIRNTFWSELHQSFDLLFRIY